MKALKRVKNSKNKTVGFITDIGYVKYYLALQNVNRIDNLRVIKNNVLKSKNTKLDIVNVSDINKEIYNTMCKKSYLLRDVQNELEYWRTNRNDFVLYLIGARQIGKTTELLKFAYKNYEQIIYVNLAQERELEEFEKVVDSNSLYFGMLNYCELFGLEEFDDDSSTILIIDEIQESHKIYNSIRALQNTLHCHVAVTGSYLGKTLNSKYFKPCGNMYDIEMLSLSFTEFCRAFNKEKLLYDIDLYGKSDEKSYKKLTELYKIYCRIGGYPAVVDEYIKTNNINKCFNILETIVNRFTEESASYFNDDKCYIIFSNVYKAAFLSIAKEKKGTSSKDIKDITNFVKLDTNEHVSRTEINKAISWLKYSKIIGSCDLYNQGNVFELLSERRFYFLDCGIANFVSKSTSIPKESIDGILTENFAYTELYRLYKTDKVKGDVPCCSVYQNYELDFLVVDNNDIKYGLEIKSSNSDNPKSLNVFVIDKPYLAGLTRGGIRETIKAIPIYTVGCRFPYD